MGKSPCYCGSYYYYWRDSYDFSIVVGRSGAITAIAALEAFASAASAAAVVGEEERPDARTVTESFMGVAKYLLNERIRLVINIMHRQNACQPYSQIRT